MRPYDALMRDTLAVSGLVSSTQLEQVDELAEGLRAHGQVVPLAVILLKRHYLTLSQANHILRATPDRLIYCDICQSHRFATVAELTGKEIACEECGSSLPIANEDLLCSDTTAEQAAASLVGNRFGSLQVEAQVESGRYAGWLAATDVNQGRRLMLRAIPARFRRSKEEFRRLREDFYRIKLITSTARPDAFDLVQLDGQHFVTQAPIVGESITELVASRGRFGVDEVLKVMIPIAELVVAGHRQDLLDFDLNPDLIILDEFGRPRAMDVSTGFLDRQDVDAVRYRPPERIAHKTIEEPADIYSFFAVVYTMLAGRPAFPGDDVLEVATNILAGKRAPLDVAAPGTPHVIVELVERGLAISPAARFPDFKEVLDQLRILPELLGGSDPAAASRPAAERRTQEIERPMPRGFVPPSAAQTGTFRRPPPVAPRPAAAPTTRPQEAVTEASGVPVASEVQDGLQQIQEYGRRARDFMKLKRYTLAIKSLSRILEYEGKAAEYDTEVGNAKKVIELLKQKEKTAGA